MLTRLKLDRIYDGLLFLAEAARNPPILKSHHHVELELNLLVRGSITYVVDGKRFTFTGRTLLWMFPSQEHQLVDRSDDAQYYVAVFTPRLIAQACKGRGYEGLKRRAPHRTGVLHTTLDPETFDLVRRTMDALMRESLDPDILNREAGYGDESDFRYQHGDPDGLNAGLRHLLLMCWRSQTTGTSPTGAVSLHPLIRRALELLSETGSDEKVGQLAKRCGVSETYLSRVFRRQVGVPLSRYRNSLRLSRFWEAYRRSEQKTVTEAMFEAGFGSYAQFYRVFAQAYGEGPRSCLRIKPKDLGSS